MQIVKIYLHKILFMLLIDYQYFGNICFLEVLHQQKQVIFDEAAFHTKRSFKNRMVILSAQGPLHLSIPLVGGRDQKTAIKDIRIAYDTPWLAQHYKAIKTCYKRAPYFEYYEKDIENIYAKKNEFLIDFLNSCHDFVKKAVRGKWEILPWEKKYLDSSNTIKLLSPWQPNNFSTFPVKNRYQQVFTTPSGFMDNLCILDWLFCVGGKEISKQWFD